MSEANEKEPRELLKSAFSPMGDAELQRDLWPQALRRLDERAIQAPWFDWALAAGVLAWLLWFPESLPVLLYHM